MHLDLENLVTTTINNFYNNKYDDLEFEEEPYFDIVNNLIFRTSESDIQHYLIALLRYSYDIKERPSDIFYYFWDSIYGDSDPECPNDIDTVKGYLEGLNFDLIRALFNTYEFTNYKSFVDVLLLTEDVDKLIKIHECTFHVVDVGFDNRVYAEKEVPEFLVRLFTKMHLEYHPDRLVHLLAEPTYSLERHINVVVDECVNSNSESLTDMLNEFPDYANAVRNTINNIILGEQNIFSCLKNKSIAEQNFLLQTFTV